MTGSTFLCGAIRSENIVFFCLGNDLYLSGVGKLEHGARLILAGVLQDDDGVLAGRRLQDVPEVGRHRGQDHLVRIQGAPVRARQSNVDKILKMFFSSYYCKERHTNGLVNILWLSSLHVGHGGPWRWRPRWGWSHSSAGCTSETPPSHTTGTSLKMASILKSGGQPRVGFALLTLKCHLIEWRSSVGRLIWVSLSDAISSSGRRVCVCRSFGWRQPRKVDSFTALKPSHTFSSNLQSPTFYVAFFL